MRSLILAVFLVSFSTVNTAARQTVDARWQILPGGPDAVRDAPNGSNRRHDDIVFVNENIGWIVNLAGQIWKTEDGGASWVKQLDTGFQTRFRSAAFASDQVGWAGTLNVSGVLYETRDGGETWDSISSRITGSPPAGICGMWAVNESVIYGAGAFFGVPRVIKTVDGGRVWSSTRMQNQIATIVDIYFQDENTGFVVGGSEANLTGNAIILRTVNGGLTWSEVFRTTRRTGIGGEWGWKISFPSQNVGYVSVEYLSNTNGEPAKVLKTMDGGITWTELPVTGSTERAGLQGIGFISEEVGWTSGRGTTSLTRDGGMTWTRLAPYSEGQPGGQLDGATNRIIVLNDSLAFAVGRHVYKFEGRSTATPVEVVPGLPSSFAIKQNYPNPFRPSTRIDYAIYRTVPVRIVVFDVLGRRVRSLVDHSENPGSYSVVWDGRNEGGMRVSSGTYFYLLDVGEALEMKQMVLLR